MRKVLLVASGAIMRDAGMNVVRVTPSANDYTYTVGGNMTTPVPISANLDDNVARFNRLALNRFESRLFTVEHTRRTTMARPFRARQLEHSPFRRQIPEKDDETAGWFDRTVNRPDHFLS